MEVRCLPLRREQLQRVYATPSSRRSIEVTSDTDALRCSSATERAGPAGPACPCSVVAEPCAHGRKRTEARHTAVRTCELVQRMSAKTGERSSNERDEGQQWFLEMTRLVATARLPYRQCRPTYGRRQDGRRAACASVHATGPALFAGAALFCLPDTRSPPGL